MLRFLYPHVCACFFALRLFAAQPAELAAVNAATMRAYKGESVRMVDTSTLTGKVLCGYQGWFNAEGDGSGRAYHHWTKGNDRPAPGNLKVDMWPDVSELGADERFPTDLKHADGRTAEIFSSANQKTVLRHFQWMRDYTVAECGKLVELLKQDGCKVMLGVPTGWRELNRDAANDPALHEVLKLTGQGARMILGEIPPDSPLPR